MLLCRENGNRALQEGSSTADSPILPFPEGWALLQPHTRGPSSTGELRTPFPVPQSSHLPQTAGRKSNWINSTVPTGTAQLLGHAQAPLLGSPSYSLQAPAALPFIPNHKAHGMSVQKMEGFLQPLPGSISVPSQLPHSTSTVYPHTLILPARNLSQNSLILSAVSSSDSGLYLVISSSRVIRRTAGHSSFFRPKNSKILWLSLWSLSMKMNRILGGKK